MQSRIKVNMANVPNLSSAALAPYLFMSVYI